MVSLPKLSNCCACISLKTGTLIIGALNLVGCVIAIIASIGTMAMAGLKELVDGMELALDQNMPGWRNHFDKQDISSGSILPTHDTQLTICSVRLLKEDSGMKRLNLRNLYHWLWHAGRLNLRHSDFRLPCPWNQNGEDVFHSLLFSE